MLEHAPYNDDDPEPSSLEYDIHATQQSPAATLPLPTWKAISPDRRAIWDQLTDADNLSASVGKAAIISAKPRIPGSSSQCRPASRQAHLTDISNNIVEIPDDNDHHHSQTIWLSTPSLVARQFPLTTNIRLVLSIFCWANRLMANVAPPTIFNSTHSVTLFMPKVPP